MTQPTTQSTIQSIKELEQRALEELAGASDADALEQWRVAYLGRRGALSAIEARRTYEDYRFEHTLVTPVLVLRNRYLGGWRFRPELTICGEDADDLLSSWTYTARKIRSILRCSEAAKTGGDA